MKKAPALLIMLMTLCIAAGALAGNEPLLLDASSITDNQKKVALNESIILTFSNNVINASVRDNNAGCFRLLCAGKEVAIDVVMADDQVQPDQKRIITIDPKEPLQKGRRYTLQISKDLTAKNGNSLGSDMNIAFTTQGYVSLLWYIIAGAALICAGAAIAVLRINVQKKQKKVN